MTARATSPDWTLLGCFALGSFGAVALGAVAMAGHDIAPIRWIMNLGGWAVGGILALVIAAVTKKPAWLQLCCVAGVVILLASLAGPAQLGVHRWFGIGPLTINAAALVLPAVLVATARLPASKTLAQACALITGIVLAVQPDGSQSVAFTAASLIIFLRARHWRTIGLCALLVVMSAIAVLRPDPLLPVAEVERIVGLAWAISGLLAAAMVLALAATAAIPIALQPRNRAAQAFSVYAAVIMLAPLFGWFPVPLAGAGMSFVLGLWLGICLLAARRSC